MQTRIFFVLFTLISCDLNIFKGSLFTLNESDIEKISLFSNSESKEIFFGPSAPFLSKNLKIPLSEKKTSSWIQSLQKMELDNSAVGFDLNTVKPMNVVFHTKQGLIQLTFWQNENKVYLRFNDMRLNSKRQKAGVLKANDSLLFILNSLIDLKHIYMNSLDLSDLKQATITYLANNYTLSSDEKNEFINLLKLIEVKDFALKQINNFESAKNYDIGLYKNENIKNVFEINLNETKYIFGLGRPNMSGFEITIWYSKNPYLSFGQFKNWNELKKFEAKILNKK